MASSKSFKNSQTVNESQDQFAFNIDTPAGLYFGYHTGIVYNSEDNTLTEITGETKSLSANTVSWIVLRFSSSPIDIVVLEGATWDATSNENYDIPLWKVTTDADSVTAREDLRSFVQYPKLSILPSTTQIGTSDLDSGNRTLQFYATGNVSPDSTITSNTSGDLVLSTGVSDSNITIKNNGNIELNFGASKSIELETSTGDITVTADVVDVTSSDLTLTSNNDLNIDSTTGDITLTTSSDNYVFLSRNPPDLDESLKVATTQWVKENINPHPVTAELKKYAYLHAADYTNPVETRDSPFMVHDRPHRWAGGVLAPDGCIYCSPYSRNSSGDFTILKINPILNTHTEIVVDTTGLTNFSGSSEPRWASGVLVVDGDILFVPSNYSYQATNDTTYHFFKFNPTTETFQWKQLDSEGTFGWMGSIVDPITGLVYAAPYQNNTVIENSILCIAPWDSQFTLLSTITTIGGMTSNGIKMIPTPDNVTGYRGVVLGSDDNMYFIPSSDTADTIVRLAVGTTMAGTHTPTSLDFTIEGGDTGVDKWSGGVLGADGKIYCAPLDADNVLVIDPSKADSDNTKVQRLFSGVVTTATASSQRWMGGCVTPSGEIMFAPFDNDKALFIRPIRYYTNNQARLSIQFNETDLNSPAYTNEQRFWGAVQAPNGLVYLVPHGSLTDDPPIIGYIDWINKPGMDMNLLLSPYLNKY